MRRLILDHALLPDGWAENVGIDIDGGMILAVHANASADGRERIAGIALPGLPNLHSHTFQRGMAGLAETRGPEGDSFWTWRQVMYRFLGSLTPDDVEAIAAFAMMEMLEGGFTALAEFHYLHRDVDGRPYADVAELSHRIAAAAQETGMGLTLLPVFYAQGGFGGVAPTEGQRRFINDVDSYARLLEGARKAVAELDDAVIGVAPHSLRAVTPESLRDVVPLAGGGPIHIHIAEQVKEVEDCLTWSGQRPVAWLLDHAPVDRRWCLIHATHLDAREVKGIAMSGAVAGLCPITEANLGDGIFEGADHLAAGGRFGVGSDSNIEISASAELKQFEYSQRLKHRARNVLARREGQSTGRSLYDRALAGGARALGRRIGAIEAGQRADLVVLDAGYPDLAAVSGDRWIDSYVFVAGKAAIDTVFVAGNAVVRSGRHIHRETIRARYGRAMARILA
ncbi:formimidoylglutamate deiminase [Microvirga tunisiensis]|uniref:Formimidoylglutamate deiminase n=1 Tax=Microvirga tunisiensis TaxID=2108360 RepID=A0A5N7MN44_9HYPH|nr:formimidoylglutamate deiminase [Microvirga tunisiensis]MPR09838.1 formimidoylglutamate deiminase [Microvirga tunisiensis]MPR28070.1 formimidoylglutamate deiminase [Microvirga tunisiensis]